MTPLQPDTFYHIYNRANGRENLFDEKQNYHFFLEKLEESELEKLVSRQFANLFSSYTQAFHKLYQRTGSLFQKNFKRKEIDSGEYLNGGHIIHPYQSCTSRRYRYNRRSAHSSYPDVVYGKNEYIDLSALIDRFGTKEQFVGCHKNKTAWELGSEITLEEV